MSHHTRGILIHVAVGLAASALMFGLLPGARTWHAPTPMWSRLTFQSMHQALDQKRTAGDLGTMQQFYAPGFRKIEVELKDGETRELDWLEVLESFVQEKTDLKAEFVYDPDAWKRVSVFTSRFYLKADANDEGKPYRHRFLWSWDGSDWKIVRQIMVPEPDAKAETEAK